MADIIGITTVIGAFITAAILIGIGTQILGNVNNDCTELPGNATSGWEGLCEDSNTRTQTAYNLFLIVLIVLAAGGILYVLRVLM